MIYLAMGMLFFASAPLWYRRFEWSWRLFHDALGWHDGDGVAHGFDGVSCTSRCSRCGERVFQDSQGNWFTPSRRS